MVGAVKARRARTHHGHARLGAVYRGLHALEELVNRYTRVVAHPALDVADGNGLIDFVAAAGELTGAHADAPASCYERIVVQKDARGQFRMTVAHIVDVARNVDVSRTCLDALGGDRCEHVAAHGLGARKQTLTEVLHGAYKRRGRRAADAAKTCEHHLLGRLVDMIPVDLVAAAFDEVAKRKLNQAGACSARRAAAAGGLRDFFVVAKQDARETHGLVEYEKTSVADDDIDGVAGVEVFDRLEVKPFGSGIAPGSVVVLDPVPYAVADHVFLSCCRVFARAASRAGAKKKPAGNLF